MGPASRLAAVAVAVFLVGGCAKDAPPPAAKPAAEPEAEVAIPFTLSAHNLIVVRAVLNDRDPVDLMLHTAASDVSLTEDAVRRIGGADFTASATVTSWGGPAGSRVSTGNRLRVGDLRRDGVRLFEVKQSGVDTDGKFGLDFFGGRWWRSTSTASSSPRTTGSQRKRQTGTG